MPIGRILAVCLVALPALSLPVCAQPAQSASLKAAITFPARHPYLAVTPEEVQRAKERAARYPWAKKSLENLIQDARHKAARPLGRLPPKGDHAHWGIAAGLLQVGLPANTSPLGNLCGYQHLGQRASGRVEKIASLVFEAGPRRLRIWVVPQGGPVEVILAEGPTNSPTERKPVLILRRRGREACFLTVFEPIDPQKPVDIREHSRIEF